MQTMALSRLYESPTNPRKIAVKAKDPEWLAFLDSIRTQGILQALVVRAGARNKNETHEVVLGSRRFHAALELGLAEVPVDEREMTDKQVVEAQLVENLQRADIHPLDEADGFDNLLQECGDIGEVAAKVGRTLGYVHQRLKLRALCPAARKAYLAGELTAAVALVVARIPDDDMQATALKEITRDRHHKMGADDVSYYVQRTFMLRLKDAPFSVTDAELVPAAGACSACPKRTGNKPELFDDVADKDDMCTDPKCHASKCAAAWEQKAQAASARGLEVIEKPSAVKKIFPHQHASAQGEYVDLAATCYDDPKHRTYRQLLGKDAATAIVKSPQGAPVELVPKGDVKKKLKEAGHNFPSDRTPSAKKKPKADPKKKLEQEVEEAVRPRIIGALVERVEKQKPGPELWRALATRAAWLCEQEVLERRGVKSSAAEAYVKKLTEAQCRGFVFEVLMPIEPEESELQALCKTFGVDAKALKAAARAELEAPKPASKKAKP
jgi:ParB/RepB/Spo0J family partition protein